MCAERVAIFAAAAAGHRRVRAVAVATGSPKPASPCGACRPVLVEFGVAAVYLAGPAGRPNVAKSTLLNRLLGTKVAITASVPQTTRTVVRGIVTRPEAQIVFLDTPGIHAPRHRLGEFRGGGGGEDGGVPETLRPLRVPVVLVVNKVDGAAARRVEAVAREAQALLPVAGTYRISAPPGLGVERLGVGG